jgi:putative tryptophan/tyrosine transport system substrate-binding protein
MYCGLISCLNGGHILRRPSISNRINLQHPVSFCARRIFSAVLVCFFICVSPVLAEPLRVTVVLSEEGGVYQEFSDLLRVKMPVAKYALNTVNVNQTLVASDLYIAVGMKAAGALASKEIPVLNVLVSKDGYEKLPHSPVSRTVSRSAIYIDQSMERQVAFLLAALPSTRNVGVLYSTPPQELSNVKHLLAEKSVRLHDKSVGDAPSLNDALESILGESEVLFVLADSGVYNAGTIRNILLTSYRKKIPLVGISQAYVKAGALCAIYSTPNQIATQSAEAIRYFSDFGKLPSSQHPKEFEVSVNKQVARSLDLRIDDAERLRDEIKRIP